MSNVDRGTIVKIVVGIACFGILMGFRSEAPNAWLKTGLAAAAGGVLGVTIVLARKK